MIFRQQEKVPFEQLQIIKRVVKNAKTAVAGGITGQKDKQAVAAKIQELVKQGQPV